MKNRLLLLMILLAFAILLPSLAWAQFPPTADANVNETSATNFGAAGTLQVANPNVETFIQFDLSSLPAGTTGTSVGKATLVLYASAVAAAGSFDVYEVGGAWSELTITGTNEPVLGTLIAPAVPIALANKNNFVVIDVTQAVKDWLNATVPNHGLALQPNASAVNVTFNSKENAATSHNPQLNISLIEPPGDITQITCGPGLVGCGSGPIVPIGVDSTQIPFLDFPNTFTANQTVSGTLSASSLSGNGSSLTNVNASLLGGLSPSSFALVGTPNIFSGNQSFLGNVGIGTTTPGSGLDIRVPLSMTALNLVGAGGTVGGANPIVTSIMQPAAVGTASHNILQLHIPDATPGNGAAITFSANGSDGNRWTYGLVGHVIEDSGVGGGAPRGSLVFQTANGTVSAEQMRITSGGNVGVGTTNPTDLITVQANSPFVPQGIRVNNSAKDAGGPGYIHSQFLTEGYTSDGTLIQGVLSNSGRPSSAGSVDMGSRTNHALSFLVNANPQMWLDTSGNLGIGTLVPTARLEVAGTMKVSGAGNGITFPDGTKQTTAANGGGGGGSISGVTAGTGLTGGGTSGNVTLTLNTGFTSSLYAQLSGGNNLNGTQTISGDLAITGSGDGVRFPDGTKQTTASSPTTMIATTIAQNYSGTDPVNVSCPAGYTVLCASCNMGVSVVLNGQNPPPPLPLGFWRFYLIPTVDHATGVHCEGPGIAATTQLVLRCAKLQ